MIGHPPDDSWVEDGFYLGELLLERLATSHEHLDQVQRTDELALDRYPIWQLAYESFIFLRRVEEANRETRFDQQLFCDRFL
jgi:hypothetical protein